MPQVPLPTIETVKRGLKERNGSRSKEKRSKMNEEMKMLTKRLS